MREREMSISAFARRSMLSPKALRLYDELGLLRPQRTDAYSGYRYYQESQLERARMISLLRKAAMPLAEIARVLDRDPAEASSLIADWLAREEDAMSARRELLRYVRGSVLGDPSALRVTHTAYSVEIRQVPETTFLVTSGNVIGPDLPRYILQAEADLGQRAMHYGGPQGPFVVVYHGVVDADSDGPVDVCLPIAAGSVAHGIDHIRTESSHAQAFTSIVRRQLAFPEILQIYHALRVWIDAAGHERAGSPREIYHTEIETAAPDQPVCDIAWPIIVQKGRSHD